MPNGLVRTGDFSGGNPVPATDPRFDSNPVTWSTPNPTHFGNPVPIEATFNSNPVNWHPDPAHFGNLIPFPTPGGSFLLQADGASHFLLAGTSGALLVS